MTVLTGLATIGYQKASQGLFQWCDWNGLNEKEGWVKEAEALFQPHIGGVCCQDEEMQ